MKQLFKCDICLGKEYMYVGLQVIYSFITVVHVLQYFQYGLQEALKHILKQQQKNKKTPGFFPQDDLMTRIILGLLSKRKIVSLPLNLIKNRCLSLNY